MSRLEKLLEKYTSLYLLDLSWMCYRYISAYSMGYEVEGIHIPTSHYYGIYVVIRDIINKDKDACIIVCEDSEPVTRNKIMEEAGLEYKADRRHEGYSFYKDISKIKAITCSIPNVYWSKMEDKESDDLISACAQQAESNSNFKGRIYIHSGDNDLLQNVSERVSVVRNRVNREFIPITPDTIMNEGQFTKKFHGVGPKDLVKFRSIIGDTSDNLKGIPRFPREIAKSIATTSDWKPITDKEKKWYKIYLDNQDIVKRNYRLMKLLSDFEVDITKPVVNKEKLKALLDRLQLNSCKKWMQTEGWL